MVHLEDIGFLMKDVLFWAYLNGSTGVACPELDRKLVGFELEQEYFEIAKKRLSRCEGNNYSEELMITEENNIQDLDSKQ